MSYHEKEIYHEKRNLKRLSCKMTYHEKETYREKETYEKCNSSWKKDMKNDLS